jgi:hypothetical protein
LIFAVAASAMPAVSNNHQSNLHTSNNGGSGSDMSNGNCSSSRQCMTNIVTKILDSMVAHNPDTLPLATIYRATETPTRQPSA